MAFITFDAPVAPEDRIEGREPPPGRDLAQGLMDRVAAAGFLIAEAVEPHDSYGWAFSARDGDGRPVWCMLQLSDEGLVITHSPAPTFRRLFAGGGQSPAHDRFDAAVIRALTAMPDVSNVRWFRTEQDLRQRSAGQP